MQADEAHGIASLGPNQGSPSKMDRARTDTEVQHAYGVPVDGGIESLRDGG